MSGNIAYNILCQLQQLGVKVHENNGHFIFPSNVQLSDTLQNIRMRISFYQSLTMNPDGANKWLSDILAEITDYKTLLTQGKSVEMSDRRFQLENC